MFTANNGTLNELWRSDGTTANTQPLKNVAINAGCRIALGGVLYFAGAQTASNWELWKSDGTPDGTVLVKELISGTTPSNPCEFTAVDDTLFFSAMSPSQGPEFWKTDGTSAGTVLVKDINPGPNSSAVGAGGSGVQRHTRVHGIRRHRRRMGAVEVGRHPCRNRQDSRHFRGQLSADSRGGWRPHPFCVKRIRHRPRALENPSDQIRFRRRQSSRRDRLSSQRWTLVDQALAARLLNRDDGAVGTADGLTSRIRF